MSHAQFSSTQHGLGITYTAYICDICPPTNECSYFKISLNITGIRVTALFKPDGDKVPPGIWAGNKVIVCGGWANTPWKSNLIVHQISLQQQPYSEHTQPALPKQPLLGHLLEQLQPHLKEFVTSALASDFGERFMSIPASHQHHHIQERGLLMHSLECALIVSQVANIWLNRAEAELVIVAAFLHDFGKSRTHQSTLGAFISHEAFTLELLAPFLAKLESYWPVDANMLRHLLSEDNKRDRFPAFPGKLLIKMADQFSTGIDRRTTIFNGHPGHHHFANDKQYRQRYLRVPL